MSIGIADVDLLTGRCDVTGKPRASSLVLLRIGDTPIGRVNIVGSAHESFGDAVAAAISIQHADRALRALLAAWLRQSHDPAGFLVEDAFELARIDATRSHAVSGPGLTVAICTRNRPQELRRTLHAMTGAIREHDELLVVLNAPPDDVPSIHRESFPTVRFIVEPRPGLAWARNRALVEFRSDIILFTDDDCVPDRRWVDKLRSLFWRNADVDVATGLVEPLELETPAQQLFERYGGFGRGYVRRWIHASRRVRVAGAIGNVGTYGTGANFALRRRLVSRGGPFDAALGSGTVAHGGEDLEFLFRALKAGALLAYEPGALIRHDHRHAMIELESQIEGWGSGFACAIARSTLAFPEELTAYRALQARIVLLYHARRALLHPGLSRLARAELRGMRGSVRRYSDARLHAEQIAACTPSPAPDAAPNATGSAASAPRRHAPTCARLNVDLRALHQSLTVEDDVDEASVSVRFGDRTIGDVRLPVVNGSLGADRLFDAVIDRLGAEVAGGDWNESVRLIQRRLADTGRRIVTTAVS